MSTAKYRQLRKLVDECGGLMGTAEVAETLGIAGQNLAPSGDSAPRGLPEPVYGLRATRVWIANEIREFAAERKAKQSRRGLDQSAH